MSDEHAQVLPEILTDQTKILTQLGIHTHHPTESKSSVALAI